MRVLVDTTIWSLALRRRAASRSQNESRLVKTWEDLIKDDRIILLGMIRQEVLSGIAESRQFEKLRDALAAFPDETILTSDHVRAAEHFNRCRASGVAGSPVDFLITATAERLDVPIFTTDLDFVRFAKHLPISLFGSTTTDL
ncbi:MAG TPA: PIN domain-containing protein [Thermoanaerobaculia bacterium]